MTPRTPEHAPRQHPEGTGRDRRAVGHGNRSSSSGLGGRTDVRDDRQHGRRGDLRRRSVGAGPDRGFPEQYWFDISPDGGTLAGSTFEQGSVVGLVDTSSGAIRRRPLPEGADFAAFGMPTAFEPDGSAFVTLECRPCDDRSADRPGATRPDRRRRAIGDRAADDRLRRRPDRVLRGRPDLAVIGVRRTRGARRVPRRGLVRHSIRAPARRPPLDRAVRRRPDARVAARTAPSR